jgi:hypothetical protein
MSATISQIYIFCKPLHLQHTRSLLFSYVVITFCLVVATNNATPFIPASNWLAFPIVRCYNLSNNQRENVIASVMLLLNIDSLLQKCIYHTVALLYMSVAFVSSVDL